MGFKLNPGAVEFFPALGHRRGKRADWRWTSVSKQQIRYAGGDERCGRRRVGLLNPLSGETHKQGMYLDRWTKQKISNGKKRFAKKCRRRTRPERRRIAKTSHISLCVAPVALAIVFMPGLYLTAYRATFPAFFMRLALVCFYCLCVFVYVFYFIATKAFAGYFLSVLFCLLSMLISDSRFDLVRFRPSCDHGWIRSGPVNVRKQQQLYTIYDKLYTI